jgi:hypothetical protein
VRRAGRVLGVLLVALGLLTIAIAVAGFLDPLAAKMADDNDPFGASSRADAVAPLLFGAALGGVGWLLIRSR